MMPKISVIIPVYNVEKYLGECLDSILGQTLKDIEVICVDDGSTDGSPRILSDYAAKDARVRLFSSPHAGAFRAREVGVNAASGEFIHFMDADDMLASNAFEQLCTACERENLDQIIFASSVFCEDDVPADLRAWAGRMVRYYSISPACCGKVMGGMDLMRTLFENDCYHVSPPLRLIRATVVRDRDYPFPDATTRADNYFTTLSLYYSGRAMAISDRFYRRRVRNGSITSADGAFRRHSRNILAVLIALYRFAPLREELRNPETVLARFSAQLSVAMYGKSWHLTPDERLGALAEVLESASPEECAFVLQVQMIALRELKRRPKPEFGTLFKALFHNLLNRVRGRRSRPSFIR
ncbi:MAG: glycosyltransferase [Lentisphaerae bacterium]|nr:glycosyltransferase [Lentisphaerota bacterium]